MPFKDAARKQEYDKQYRLANPEVARTSRKKYKAKNPHTPEERRKWSLKRNYGITPERYDQLFAEQCGVCAICGTNKHGGNSKSNHFQIDHCHLTGKIRGLLCAKCNRGLGLLGDTVEALEKVLVYLKKERNE